LNNKEITETDGGSMKAVTLITALLFVAGVASANDPATTTTVPAGAAPAVTEAAPTAPAAAPKMEKKAHAKKKKGEKKAEEAKH
jgi:hypothetical protein